MRYLLPLPLLLLTAIAQQPKEGPTFEFGTPAEWRGEVIQLPPGFARDLGWKGTENIRFAPGMFKPDQESFFSYLLVFLLEPGSDIGEASIRKEVLTYYRGLAQAVGGKKIPGLDTDAFKLTVKAAEKTTHVPAGAKDGKAWTGTLEWIEPFATGKAQTLNLEVHAWNHGKQPAIYFTVSPQATDHKLWDEMRTFRSGFTFKARE